MIELLAKRNFKEITIANALRSGQPIISSSVVNAYNDKIHLYNSTNASRNNESYSDYIHDVPESNFDKLYLGVAKFTFSNKKTMGFQELKKYSGI